MAGSLHANINYQAFSTTPRLQADLAKLVLIGRLGKNPEVRTTRSDKEYVSYVRLLVLSQFGTRHRNLSGILSRPPTTLRPHPTLTAVCKVISPIRKDTEFSV